MSGLHRHRRTSEARYKHKANNGPKNSGTPCCQGTEVHVPCCAADTLQSSATRLQ